MATTNLFYDPVFKDGAFTSSDARVRLYALQKTMRSMDLGAELGAHIYVFWGGREGAEVDAAKDARDALKWNREALIFLCEYSIEQDYDYKFALEATQRAARRLTSRPCSASLRWTIPKWLALISGTRTDVGPELLSCGGPGPKQESFHIDLNDQKGPRFDQDLRFGSESIKNLFFLVKLLEESYEGPRHFDAHAYRSEDEDGVWEFAAGCMRNYLILKEKARRFNEDPEIQAVLSEIRAVAPGFDEPLGAYTSARAQKIKSLALDRAELASRKLPYERLDQLTVDLLLGVR